MTGPVAPDQRTAAQTAWLESLGLDTSLSYEFPDSPPPLPPASQLGFAEPGDDDDPELEDEPTALERTLASQRERERAAREAAGPAYQAKRTKVTHRAAMFMRGELKVRDLDDEELAKGRFRDSDGRFRGRSASKIPVEFHKEIVRRLLERGAEKLQEDFLGSIDVMTEIMYDDTVDATVRLRAADMIATRVAGKPADKVELSVEVKPWEKTLKGIVRTPPPELLAQVTLPEIVVDAEEVGDDDD